ncbi:SRPBCC family protein [Chryseobacterium sp. MFBS3-17]|uniref:SRPBCC family protein n=1 Tax=Chryseobacterium sp. MFBS3-17 TaxID=2886689 RepID=UPI001D0F46E1|nr:SRPBCC family protein [Chryseobacterium sp. MFBS3-17]MCC2590283.1 SRPBCC family protein [Chryseobacterium sp. MFBS3-17]
MRFFKIGLFIIALILGAYAASMYYLVDESNTFKVEKEINYPVEKVFPQFNRLQNFTRWNAFFSSSKTMRIDYYSPYQGKDAALSYHDPETRSSGEMYIRYHNENRTLRMQHFEGKEDYPTLIDIKFEPVGAERTRISWTFHTPKQRLMSRISNLWTEDDFVDNLDKSMAGLTAILSNQVEKEYMLSDIKYDSLMVQQEEGQLILGMNVTTSNKKDALYKNVLKNYNTVYNFVTSDLGKRHDEFGYTVILTDADNFKDNEVSYFIGVPLSKRSGLSDNSFNFRTVNEAQTYTIYYSGSYSARIPAIQKLLARAKKDSMRHGELMQVFLENPQEGSDVLMKLSLPVYR